MTGKTLLTVDLIMWLHITAALYISDDARVEITCTGSGLSSGLPQWSINGTTVTDHGTVILMDMGVAIVPENLFDAVDENNNVFQTLVINGSAEIHGITIRCSFEGEDVYSEIVFLSNLPAPEVLEVDVSQGLVQWQPPYSSSEDETIRYFLYNIRYSVEVTDTLTQATIMYNETTDTSFSFQLPPDCIAYKVTVRARCHTSVGDPAVMNMPATGEYELPEPVDANDITTTLQGSTLTVTVTAEYELTCRSATNISIIYNGQHYIMSATLKIESIVGACSFDVVASNPAGNSDPTRVTIDDCDSTSEEPTLKFENSNQNIPLIAGVVAAVGGVLLLLAIVPGILIVVLRIKRNRNNKVLDNEKRVHSNTHHEQKPEQITEKRKADTPTGYIPIQSQSSNASQPSPESSLSSTSSTSPRTNSTSCDSSPPSSPLEAPNNEKYDLVKPEEEKYAELAVLKQKTKCVQPPAADEGVIYSGIQHTKQQPVYADVALQKPKCSPPAAGSAEPVLYSLVQLQEQV